MQRCSQEPDSTQSADRDSFIIMSRMGFGIVLHHIQDGIDAAIIAQANVVE